MDLLRATPQSLSPGIANLPADGLLGDCLGSLPPDALAKAWGPLEGFIVRLRLRALGFWHGLWFRGVLVTSSKSQNSVTAPCIASLQTVGGIRNLSDFRT